ncbi:hypothetical protein [Flexithrix dorotheae]|uniref:hypothetical protein n=1 Tax=Flexithrix dorotheae TaxID=70993 RepID=UPI0003663E29|nr:hypothetical protein [Flexithrix dorotheae]
MRIILKFGWVYIFLLFAGCNDCEPVADPGNTLIVSFYEVKNYLCDDKLVRQKVPFLSIKEKDNDNILYPADTPESDSLITTDNITYALPMPFDKDNSTYEFVYPKPLIKTYTFEGETRSDTLANLSPDFLEVSFLRKVIFESPDCGLIQQLSNIKLNSEYPSTSCDKEAKKLIGFEAGEVFIDALQSNDTTNIRIFF